MQYYKKLLHSSLICLSLVSTGNALAGITVTGTVTPDHTTWDDETQAEIAPTSASTGSVILDGSDTAATVYSIRVGSEGNGSLQISNGAKFYSYGGSYVGYDTGVKGTVLINGGTWTAAGIIRFGNYGEGNMIVSNGGRFSSSQAVYIGNTKGNVTVKGRGSVFETTVSSLTLGYSSSGAGSMTIADQATASIKTSVTINNISTLSIDAGSGSTLTVLGGNTINNKGTVRLYAGAAAAAGTYTPITASSWSGSGTYLGIGGQWNATTHKFVVSGTASASAGSAYSLNLANTQRMFITDADNHTMGISFQYAASTISVNADYVHGVLYDSLSASVDPGSSILSAWTFASSAIPVGNAAYISLDVGDNFKADSLTVWHFSGSTWEKISPSDFVYDGEYASFMATDLNGYAVAAPVPEPASLLTIGIACTTLLIRRRR